MRPHQAAQDAWLLQNLAWSEKEIIKLEAIDLNLYQGAIADGITGKIRRLKKGVEQFTEELQARGFFWDENEQEWRREIGNAGE